MKLTYENFLKLHNFYEMIEDLHFCYLPEFGEKNDENYQLYNDEY